MRAIGIDLGTTSICGILIDTDSGKVLQSRTENSNAFIEGKFSWERLQQPEKIISLAMDILETLMCEDVSAIGVTGQMHGIVYFDCKGTAVSPLYTWQDGRGNQPYLDTTYAQYLLSHSGYGNVTDFYNRQNGLVPNSAVGYCTIHDYFVMRLCNLTKPQIHISNAASFGCFDIKKNCFTYDCSIEPVLDFTVAGKFRDIPVGVAIGDNQSSVFSSLASTDSILLNIGTGSQVSIVSDKIVEAPGIETRPYFEGQYLVVGSALCGGRAYAVLKDFYVRLLKYVMDVTDDQVYHIMDKMLSGQSAFASAFQLCSNQIFYSGKSSETDTCRYCVYNIEHDSIYSFAGFPKYDLNIQGFPTFDMSKQLAYQGDFVFSPTKDKIFFFFFYGLGFDIVDTEKWEVICQQIYQYPDVKLNHISELNINKVSRNPESLCGFIDACATNEYIYVLYTGKHFNEDYSCGKHVLQYDWKGEPQVHYILDAEINSIAVDEKNKLLYAATNEENARIIKYEMGK